MKKIAKVFLALAVVWFGATAAVGAADFVAPTKSDNGTVVVGSGETRKNLYTVGSNVFVNSQVQGDLFVGGGNVIIDGGVESDITAAAGTLTLNGRIGGDARLGGGTITINSEIGGDLLIGGGQVFISEKARVAGDLVVGGGTVTVDGPVLGSIRAGSGSIIINNQVGGSVSIRAEDSVVFGDRARISGKITVKAPQEPEVRSGAVISSPEFTRVENRDHNRNAFAKLFTLWFLVKVLAYMLAGFVLLYIIPKHSKRVLTRMRERFWPSAGVGVIVAIVVPIVSLILLFTFIGYYIALIGFVWYAMVLLLSCLFAALFTGSYIVQKLMKKPELQFDWQAVVIGSVVYVLIGAIPVIGWIVQTIIALAAIGTFVRVMREQVKQGEE